VPPLASVANRPSARADCPVVEPDVGSAGLPPIRQRELVPVCGQVAKTVQRRSRTVGYDALLRRPFPRRNLWGELEPRRTKVEIIRQRRPGQAVHAMRYPVEDARLGEPLQRSLRDTGTFGHLIMKPGIRKTSLSWSPVTESNRRPSPYHACRFRLTASGWVGLPQFRGISVSGYVAHRLPLPGVVVTWVVTGFPGLLELESSVAECASTMKPTAPGVGGHLDRSVKRVDVSAATDVITT
jgi:hypothetical protein